MIGDFFSTRLGVAIGPLPDVVEASFILVLFSGMEMTVFFLEDGAGAAILARVGKQHG